MSNPRKTKAAAAGKLSKDLQGVIALQDWRLLVPLYLMASYAYHSLDRPLLGDDEYDRLCRLLDQYWDEADHRHRRHVDRAALKAGTGYYLTEALLPSIVVGATHRMLRT